MSEGKVERCQLSTECLLDDWMTEKEKDEKWAESSFNNEDLVAFANFVAALRTKERDQEIARLKCVITETCASLREG